MVCDHGQSAAWCSSEDLTLWLVPWLTLASTPNRSGLHWPNRYNQAIRPGTPRHETSFGKQTH